MDRDRARGDGHDRVAFLSRRASPGILHICLVHSVTDIGFLDRSGQRSATLAALWIGGHPAFRSGETGLRGGGGTLLGRPRELSSWLGALCATGFGDTADVAYPEAA